MCFLQHGGGDRHTFILEVCGYQHSLVHGPWLGLPFADVSIRMASDVWAQYLRGYIVIMDSFFL